MYVPLAKRHFKIKEVLTSLEVNVLEVKSLTQSVKQRSTNPLYNFKKSFICCVMGVVERKLGVACGEELSVVVVVLMRPIDCPFCIRSVIAAYELREVGRG